VTAGGLVRGARARRARFLSPTLLLLFAALAQARAPLVLLTDFGTQDGAVSAMKGVAYGVSQDLLISDLSHENPSIFDGAYRLYQTEQFWPVGTVFVAVVDPGVGTERLSVVMKTRTGHYFVGPDNGLLSLVAERDGIEGLRQVRAGQVDVAIIDDWTGRTAPSSQLGGLRRYPLLRDSLVLVVPRRHWAADPREPRPRSDHTAGLLSRRRRPPGRSLGPSGPARRCLLGAFWTSAVRRPAAQRWKWTASSTSARPTRAALALASGSS